jgi:hypothetical protein
MKYTDNVKTLFYQIVSPSAPINHSTKSVNRKQIVWFKFHLHSCHMGTPQEVLMANKNAQSK